MSQLLEDISSYMRDVAALVAREQEEKEEKRRKEEIDRRKGEEMRKAAMELIGSKY